MLFPISPNLQSLERKSAKGRAYPRTKAGRRGKHIVMCFVAILTNAGCFGWVQVEGGMRRTISDHYNYTPLCFVALCSACPVVSMFIASPSYILLCLFWELNKWQGRQGRDKAGGLTPKKLQDPSACCPIFLSCCAVV